MLFHPQTPEKVHSADYASCELRFVVFIWEIRAVGRPEGSGLHGLGYPYLFRVRSQFGSRGYLQLNCRKAETAVKIDVSKNGMISGWYAIAWVFLSMTGGKCAVKTAALFQNRPI
jgi:hypothetical protein